MRSRVTHSFLLLGLLLVLLPITLLSAQVVTDAEAGSHVGEQVTVRGVVANVYTSRSGNTFLNFGHPYPEQTFAGVIFRSASGRFPNPSQWEGKVVLVTGTIRLYKGKPEIILESPTQLRRAP